MTFEVLIDDNAHYQDETERRKQGEYDSYEDALAAAKCIVDEFLLQHRDQYQKASMLFNAYCNFGEDPFIIPDNELERFSARNYARQRCQQLFDKSSVDNQKETLKMPDKKFDRITYSFLNAPTPDSVSYKIQATPDSILLTVSDFNGNSEYNLPFDAEKFSCLLAAFKNHGITNCELPSPDEPCVGGTTDAIACERNNEIVFSGGVYHCGGLDMGDLGGDINGFVAEFKKLTPEVDQVLRKHGPGL